jgi:tripartite-type tricarboxylate transporter receptor subunit TctC
MLCRNPEPTWNDRVMKKCAWVVLFLAAATVLQAQEAGYPTRPVRIVVPQTAGSTVDVFARLIGDKLNAKWNVPVVIDDRPGAGGVIAMELVAKAPVDGYTLTLTTEGMITIVPHLERELHYGALTDFAPVTRVASAPYVLVVNPSLPVNSVKDLIALAKAKPGQITYASGGNGTGTHLSGELFRLMANISIVHVPYRGASLGLTDVISGQVQMMFTGLPVALAQVRGGKLKALAVTTRQRSPVLPEVPTVSESGLAGYEVAPWWGVLAPGATPRALIEKLYTDVSDVLKLDSLKEQLANQGAEPIGDSPEQFSATIKREYETWGKVVKDAGIRIE